MRALEFQRTGLSSFKLFWFYALRDKMGYGDLRWHLQYQSDLFQ